MADQIGMAAQLAGNSLRLTWYTGINWLMNRQARRYGAASSYSPTAPVPSRSELIGDLRKLMRRDAEAVRDGLYPTLGGDGLSPVAYFRRLGAMFADLPETVDRRASRDATTARQLAEAEGLPDYFAQDFHFQTGGYLSEESAKLYDLQVETLFSGSAALMRRAGLRAIAEYMRGRDQRGVSLLDVACGTGLHLRDIRLSFPAMRLTGLDLSKSYLGEAEARFKRLRPARFIAANGEDIPLEDASQDIVTSVFLFHELPPDVRRRVTGEIARVLKPGGIFVFIDSLQMGDRPDWDGLIEAFPVRFHEPYYRHYAIDDLNGMFADAGLAARSSEIAFLSKVMVRTRVQ